MSSQWPVIVSLPGPAGCRRPWTTGSAAGSTPASGMMFPRPRAASAGRSSPPAASATWPSVFAPVSPYSAESGRSPAPHASMTMTNARRTGRDVTARPWESLRPGMRLEVHILQPVGGEVRVDLRRRDVRVPEHLLQRPEVAAAGEQVRRERVPERVRAHAPVEARGARVALDDLVQALACEH